MFAVHWATRCTRTYISSWPAACGVICPLEITRTEHDVEHFQLDAQLPANHIVNYYNQVSPVCFVQIRCQCTRLQQALKAIIYRISIIFHINKGCDVWARWWGSRRPLSPAPTLSHYHAFISVLVGNHTLFVHVQNGDRVEASWHTTRSRCLLWVVSV